MQKSHSTQQPKIDSMLGWWYRIAAPPDVPDDAPLREREIVRKGKLTSATLLIEFIYITSVMGVGFTNNRALLPVLIVNYVMIAMGVVFNRYRRTWLAATVAFLTLEVGMIFNIVSLALTSGASSFNQPLFDILVQPELIAVSLFPAWMVLPIAALNCLLVFGCMSFLPKTPEFANLLATSAYAAYERPIALQIITALVTFLWVSSAFHGMRRADRAEEANKLAQELAARQQSEVQEKLLLEESIKQIIDVHTQVARGNFAARIPLNQKNILWPVAGSLNNLLARVQRWRYDSSRLEYTEQAIQRLLQEIQLAKMQGKPLQIHRTGTMLDPLLAELVVEETSRLPRHTPSNSLVDLRQFRQDKFPSS